jgi:hypothetical protein
MGALSAMAYSPRHTTNLLPTSSRMDLHPAAGSSSPRLHGSAVVPTPTPPRYMCTCKDSSSGLASWELAAGIRKLCAHAHAHNVADDRCEKRNVHQARTAASGPKLDKNSSCISSWDLVRQMKQLTKEKIKWALIYIV